MIEGIPEYKLTGTAPYLPNDAASGEGGMTLTIGEGFPSGIMFAAGTSGGVFVGSWAFTKLQKSKSRMV
ncbi:hypothetical protein [Arundinibacter roseus]|uniref:Uncharacterized protein n=1 Tax=Arundinibacter roseus TaxID=2070510 RepID=A0A4R4JWQ8_9BACT|nr:hypothetical protein [Arundinibacter roseus]TDB58552.1 hypothetical protein EZE20_23105 [Arundinibacter roseus]